MKNAGQKKWRLVQSGLGVLLALALVLGGFPGLSISALADDLDFDQVMDAAYIEEAIAPSADYANTSNVEIEEVFSLNSLWHAHEVTFDFNGGWGEHWGEPYVVLYLTHGSNQWMSLIPQPPIRDSDSFMGWCLVGDGTSLVQLHFGWVVEEPVTFYAAWLSEFLHPLHEVTFNLNGGLDHYTGQELIVLPVPDGQLLGFLVAHIFPIPSQPVRLGYSFRGWCLVGDGTAFRSLQGFGQLIQAPQTFYAVWERAPWAWHDVTFLSPGNDPWTISLPQGYVLHPDNWDIPPPNIPPLHIFDGWVFEGRFYPIDIPHDGWVITGPHTIWGAWRQPHSHFIRFDSNGGFFAHDGSSLFMAWPFHGYTLLYGSRHVPIVTRLGYSFIGWSDGTSIVCFSSGWLVQESQDFIAMWQPNIEFGNTPCADTNLVRTAAMSASSADGVRTADRANNGILTGAANSWSAASAGQEWLMADFGQPLNFNHINLYQGGNRIANYRFEHSNDGVNWTEFRSGTRIMEQGATPYSFTTPSTITARYVRLFSANSFGVLPIVVFEFEIYYMP